MPRTEKEKSKKSQKIKTIIAVLSAKYPNPKTPLFHRNIYELFVAVVLSAQMQDERLNKILPKFFEKFPDLKTLANADIKEIEKALRSVNYYKTKAKHLKSAAKKILKEFNGKIPQTLDGLKSLPGVGQKTANVILGEGFNTPQGIVVDTHVARVSRRLGLTKHKDPKKIEEDLKKIVPKKYWRDFALWLIFHGRETCKAKKPLCGECGLRGVCEWYKINVLPRAAKL